MPQTFCDFYPLANNLHVTFYRHFQKSTENEAIAKIQIFANVFMLFGCLNKSKIPHVHYKFSL